MELPIRPSNLVWQFLTLYEEDRTLSVRKIHADLRSCIGATCPTHKRIDRKLFRYIVLHDPTLPCTATLCDARSGLIYVNNWLISVIQGKVSVTRPIIFRYGGIVEAQHGAEPSNGCSSHRRRHRSILVDHLPEMNQARQALPHPPCHQWGMLEHPCCAQEYAAARHGADVEKTRLTSGGSLR